MSVVLPSFEEQNAREYSVYGQTDRHIFETEIKHSDDLERVLIYLRADIVYEPAPLAAG